MRVARNASDAQQVPLEPADTFDLGEEAASAEEAAGVWLGRKAAAKSKKKKAAAKPAVQKSARDVSVAEESPKASARPRSLFGKTTKRPDAKSQQGVASGSSDEPSSTGARPQRKGAVAKVKPKANRKKALAIFGISLAAVLIACGAVAAFWAWDTWYRYDDAADIQGEWATADGSAIVVIDSSAIHMPDLVDFQYSMDTKGKTIAYAFGDLQGGGSYVFSDDRATLTITEADGSLTVFVKRSADTTAEPRVVSAAEAAAAAADSSAPSDSPSTSEQNDSDSSSGSATAASDASVATELSEEEASEVADALSSTSGEETPGANAVVPGGSSAGAQ